MLELSFRAILEKEKRLVNTFIEEITASHYYWSKIYLQERRHQVTAAWGKRRRDGLKGFHRESGGLNGSVVLLRLSK